MKEIYDYLATGKDGEEKIITFYQILNEIKGSIIYEANELKIYSYNHYYLKRYKGRLLNKREKRRKKKTTDNFKQNT